MFCPQCGTQLPDGARFCAKCGADLTTTPQAGVIAGGDAPAVTDPAPKSHTVRNIIVAAVAVLLVAAIGVGVYFFATTPAGTPIDEEHFPDQNFCSFVATQFDTDGNGVLSAQEAKQVTAMDLSGQSGISDVTGIAVFANLQSFNLGTNRVEQVDLSQNTQVTQVSIGSSNAGSVILPSDFDLQAGLSGSASNEIQSGDIVIQADEWTTDNNGQFGPLQRYNGVLYAGKLHERTSGSWQMELDGAIPFFGNSEYFLFADNKVYWTENFPGTGIASVALYSANADGSDKKTLAQDVLARTSTSPYYLNGRIYYSAYSNGVYSKACVDAETGERSNLPDNIMTIVGVCNNRLVVTLESAISSNPGAQPTLAFFDPTTKDLSTFFTPDATVYINRSKYLASNAGVLMEMASPEKPAIASYYSADGSPLWTDKPFSNSVRDSNDAIRSSLFLTKESYYLVYETDSTNHVFAIESVDLSTNEHNVISFNATALNDAKKSLGDTYYQVQPLVKDGNSLIVRIIQRGGIAGDYIESFLYRISLDDGEAKCLQEFAAE